MTYSEFWEKHKDTPELNTRWGIPLCNQPVLIFRTLGYETLDKIHQPLADDWPGIVLYMPDKEGVNARFMPEYLKGLDCPAEREEAPGFRHKRPTDQRSILDAEHWEGTPEHVRYALGCQLDKLQDVSAAAEGTLDAEVLVELTGAMCKIGRVLFPVWRGEGFTEDVRDWNDFE